MQDAGRTSQIQTFDALVNSIGCRWLESCPRLAWRVGMLQMSRSAIRLRHYSPRTEEAYVGWIRRFVTFHHKRHPRDMGDLEVRRFLTDLAEKQSVSASTQNQALNALVFLYREVLRSPLGKMESLVSESIDISERETCRESVMLANKTFAADGRRASLFPASGLAPSAAETQALDVASER